MTNAEMLWTGSVGALADQVSESTWRSLFAGVRPCDYDGEHLVLAVPNLFVKERLESRYLALLTDVTTGVAGRPVAVALEVQTAARDAISSDDGFDDPIGNTDRLSTGEPAPRRSSDRGATPSTDGRYSQSLPLNAKYTFETFVIGTSNRFAHAAALAVAETPAKSYNPLFIHGEAGLGKTHLLQAIGHYVREHYREKRVRYVSTEAFMNEFIDAIRTNSGLQFKRRYRECDVLLVDDIQFLENKEGTQEEFFHTFNSITGAGGQIVITSDRHAKSLVTLEDRLRSRFLSGLLTDVLPPDIETRLAILRRKADSESVHIPDDVLDYIAANIKNNIRELEGALVRVSAYASLNHEAITLGVAERVLADIIAAGEPQPVTPIVIMEATSELFGFTIEELCGPARQRPLVTARQIGMYVFRELTDFSYPAIARQFGGRDHTTVMHAVEKISGLMKERRQTYDQVTELMHRIRKGA